VTRKRFLIAVLILMLAIMAGLVALLISLREATATQAVEPPGLKHVRSIYGWGDQPDELLTGPFNLVFRNGSLFVTQKDAADVVKLSPDGQFEARFGSRGREPGQIWSLTGVEVDGAGNVYVADGSHKKIVVFGPDSTYIREVYLEDDIIPLTPLIDGTRMFLTTDGGVRVLSMPDLDEISTWGSRGRAEDQYDFPNGIAYDEATETLFVGDGNNLRVKAVDLSGGVRWIFGAPPRDMNEKERLFGLPTSVVLAEGHLFVVDALDNVIHILDLTGQEVAQIGDAGSRDGQFSYPSAIAHLGGTQFAIAEWGNERIQIVEIDVQAAIEEWDAQTATTTTTESQSSPSSTQPETGTTTDQGTPETTQ
jgi:DNA-binding beta-propeller fold protein YncE